MIFFITKPVGVFMTRVFNREKTFLDLVLRPIEKLVYRLTQANGSLLVKDGRVIKGNKS